MYDADGQRLIRRAPPAVGQDHNATLYLDSQELHLGGTVAAPALAATRYYTHNSAAVAVRDAAGVTWTAGNHQGSLAHANPNGTTTTAQRRYSPWGAPRGPQPALPTQRGFLAQTEDPTSGLVYLNNRYYHPTLKHFTTTDPLALPHDPQSLNPYTYARNNPTTLTDPSGLCAGAADAALFGGPVLPCGPEFNTSSDNRGGVLDEYFEVADAFPEYSPEEVYATSVALWWLDPWGTGKESMVGHENLPLNKYPCQAGSPASVGVDGCAAGAEVLRDGGTIEEAFHARGLRDRFQDAALLAVLEMLLLSPGLGRASLGTRAAVCASFAADTPVLMANGERKPISQVEEGDYVLATDPETGQTGARQVIATLPHTDQLLTLRTSSGEVVTTENHPYWNATDQAWQESQELDLGDRLLTASGDLVTVESLDWTTVHTGAAYDLDIDDLDTFYVAAGDDDVLVHNSCLRALRDWPSRRFQFGNSTFILDRSDMTHILKRHHPAHWDGSSKVAQTFFDEGASINDVEMLIAQIAQQNRDQLKRIGSGVGQVVGTVDGRSYVLGVRSGHIGQFYPR